MIAGKAKSYAALRNEKLLPPSAEARWQAKRCDQKTDALLNRLAMRVQIFGGENKKVQSRRDLDRQVQFTCVKSHKQP